MVIQQQLAIKQFINLMSKNQQNIPRVFGHVFLFVLVAFQVTPEHSRNYRVSPVRITLGFTFKQNLNE